MGPVLSAAVVLASQSPDPDNVSAGWVGFAVFLGLAIAVFLLWLSFRKQLKKVNFEEEPDEPAPDSNGSNDAPPANPS
jgi:cytochrome c biogenesis protein CcdA